MTRGTDPYASLVPLCLDNQNLVSNAEKRCGRAETPKRPKPNEHKDFREMRVYENEVFQL